MIGYCERCPTVLAVAETRNPNARLLRHSAVPRGLCQLPLLEAEP